MPQKVQPIPAGYHTVTPYLIVRGAAAAIEYYKKAFGATETVRMNSPDGKSVAHAEIKIGDSMVMLADEMPAMGARAPQSLGGSPISIVLYVEDADAVYSRAVAGGGKVARAIEDQFYGDRVGMVEDPFGHVWVISTHVEDVPPDELARRAKEKFAEAGHP